MVNKEESRKITSEIGGICISFLFDEIPHEEDIKDTDYDNSTQVKLRVHYSHIPKMGEKEKIFDSDTWAFYKSDGKYVLQNASLESDLFPETSIILEPDLKSGNVYIRNNTINRDLLPDYLLHR